MTKRALKKGFTLIELTLSLVFVGILSVAIVLIINNTIVSYRRGMTLNQINTTGMDLVDDMRSAIQNSSSSPVTSECIVYYAEGSSTRNACVNSGAKNFITMTRYATVDILGKQEKNVPVYGAFCSGTYSYIWNSGYFESEDATVSGASPAIFKYRDASGAVKTIQYSARVIDGERPFRLLKIRDDKRSVCVSMVRKQNSDGTYANNYALPDGGMIPNVFDMSNGYGVITEEPVEALLADHNNDLVLYDLEVGSPVESTTRKNLFYSVSFILGTTRGGINIKAKGKSCKTPTEYDVEYFDYCAINKFNFAVQAGGE